MAAQTDPMLSNVLSTVIAHPLTQQELDDTQSELSSAVTDPETFSTLWELTDKIMEFYNPISSSDKTCIVISTFRQMLSNHGAIALMTDVKTINRDQKKLRSFARYLIHTVLKPMKLTGILRSVTGTPGSPSLNAASMISQMAANVQSSDRSRRDTLKEQCLSRDGFRCSFSHMVDRKSHWNKLVTPPPGISVANTQLAHVLPLALRKFDEASQVEREAAAKIWFALYRYFPSLEGKIGPDSMNQHQNLVTLQTSAHEDYDSHLLAFNPIDGKVNQYEIKNLQDAPLPVRPPSGHRHVMTLVSFDNRYPLPEPEFFRAHYQISKILEVSGIGADIEAELRASSSDPDNMNPDGSTDLEAILNRKLLMNF